MPSMRNVTMFLTALFAALMLLASPASASWTHLGGDPLMSSIKGSGQTARNDFVKKSRSAKFKLAMQRAGLNAKQRSAVASAISKGKFQKCGLKYGDKFVRMAYGASGVFVDRNVTFKDPHYKGKPAPAFCLTVVITTKQGNKTIKQTITIKVPFKCVNFAIVSITTKTTETKPKMTPETKTTTPPVASCPAGTTPVSLINSGIACQSNSATSTETAKVDNKCDQSHTTSSDQCNTVIIQNTTIIQVNANCSKVVITFSSGEQKIEYKDNNGNVVTESYCSSQTTTVTPPPTTTFTASVTLTASAQASATVACPSGSTTATASATATASGSASGSATSTVSQADADAKANTAAQAGAYVNAQANAFAKAQADAYVKCVPKAPEQAAPQVSCVWPAHVYKGGNVQIWCEASVSNGVAISLNITGGTPYAHVSGTISVNVRWDGTACPSGVSCFRATLWGDQATPTGVFAHFIATASANGKSASTTGDVPIILDDFGV